MPLQQPFPGSLRESTGAGPDFPGSSGDRERGKFRESETARLSQVAVSDDEGRPIGEDIERTLRTMMMYQKAIVLGLALITGVDLLHEVVSGRWSIEGE